MRLAIWCTSYLSGFGGAEKLVSDLVNRFADRGIETFLVTGLAPTARLDNPHYAPLNPAVRVYSNDFENPFDPRRRPFRFLAGLFRYSAAALQAGAYLRRNRIDVVHLHYVSFDVVLLIFLRMFLGYKLVVTFAGSDVHGVAKRRLAGWKVRLAARRADRVTAVSLDLCQKLASVFRCPDPVYVPNGVDREQLQRLARTSLAPVEEDQLIYCGRLSAVKRVPFLVEAFCNCLQRGCKRKLYLVGDGEDAPRVRQLIASRGAQDSVIAVGALAHAQVVRAIRQSRCLLLSSSDEGTPMVVLEALALGRPVIAADVGGLREILVDGENGYLYPADQQDLLCDAIMKVAGDRDLANRLGANGPAVVDRRFDLNVTVDRYAEIYGQLTAR